MKLGTQIRLPDGREGTVVFNGLSGEGIKWGLHNPDPEDFEGTAGDVLEPTRDMKDFQWEPDAMLRESKMTERLGMECVGEEYEIIHVPERAEHAE